jgi:hypothetical protein
LSRKHIVVCRPQQQDDADARQCLAFHYMDPNPKKSQASSPS